MNFGCPDGTNTVPWKDNRSTLADIGRLYEGVHQGTILRNAASRDGFLANIIRLDYTGGSYTSPYTGNTVGPLRNRFLLDLITREAPVDKRGHVEEFLQRVVLRGKGGSGGPSSNEFGYSDSLSVELPVWRAGRLTSEFYVSTWFVYKLRTPSGCPESKANDGSTCQAIWKPEKDMLEPFKREILAGPIREALATWPVKP